MKVVYKKTIVEQLIEAKQQAGKINKTIDYIELTIAEIRQLREELLSQKAPRGFVHTLDEFLGNGRRFARPRTGTFTMYGLNVEVADEQF